MRYDKDLAARFTAAAQDEGVYFHSLWHSGLSAMHTPEDIDEALERIERAAKRVVAAPPTPQRRTRGRSRGLTILVERRRTFARHGQCDRSWGRRRHDAAPYSRTARGDDSVRDPGHWSVGRDGESDGGNLRPE